MNKEITWCKGASDKCAGSVDTTTLAPAPALPPRQRSSSAAPWQLSSGGSSSTSSSSSSSCSSSSSSSTSSLEQEHSRRRLPIAAVAAAAAPVVISPPNYPAPPRPPSRNGGDEARIARVGGSSRGAPSSPTSCCSSVLANGTPLPRVPPPPRVPAASGSWTSLQSHNQNNTNGYFHLHHQTSSSPGSQQWASSGIGSTNQQQIRIPPATPDAPQPRLLSLTSSRHQQPLLTPPQKFNLKSSVTPMSNNVAASPPPSRPSSSASSTTSSSTPRVHDHTRPLPPPRIQSDHLLMGSSFRSVSRVPLVDVTSTTNTSSLLSSQRLVASSPAAVNNRTTSSSSPTTPSSTEVSLQSPRPDGERVTNEYIDTPFRPATNNRLLGGGGEECVDGTLKTSKKSSHSVKSERRPFQKNHHHHHHHHHASPQVHRNAVAAAAAAAASAANNNHTRPITKQPVSFTKEPLTPSRVTTVLRPGGNGDNGGLNGELLSIVCDNCGKCRCKDCREPRALPSRWLCDNSCFCSAETALDYASCLCCVKGLFYHCGDGGLSGSAGASAGSLESDDLDASNCADEPCSCTGSRKAARWTCLGALTLLLPCLLCYWPLRGCVSVCEACYAKHSRVGCRCPSSSSSSTTTHQSLNPAPTGALSTTTTMTSNTPLSDSSSRDHPEKRLLAPDHLC